MRLIILFIILISIFVGYIKISSLIEQNNLLNKYQYLVESNKNEIAILNRYILEKSNRNHRNFNRLDDYYTIDRKEFADTFPIFHKNGFNVVFLYPNSQCALISTNKALANELLFCINYAVMQAAFVFQKALFIFRQPAPRIIRVQAA